MAEENIIAYILRGKSRRAILEALSESQKISAQLEKKTRMYKTHVSRALKQLRLKGLVECVNAEDRYFKFYKLTPKGRKVLLQVRKILKEIGKI